MSNHALHQTKQPIQLVNKLFVDMCFWFLLNRNDYFILEGLELSYEKLTLNFFQSIFEGCDAHLPLIFESIYKQTRGALDRIYPMIEMVSKDSLNVIWFSDSRIIIWLGSFLDSIDVFIEKSKILSKNLFPMLYLCIADGSDIRTLLSEDLKKLQIGQKQQNANTQNVLQLKQ